MARKVIYQLVDDIDSSSLAEGEGETVQFALDGTDYEIDLSDENAKKLRDALADYVSAARTVAKSRKSKSAGSTSNRPKKDLAAIRAWARAEGHKISDRGRIPGSIIEDYEAANA
ncbi:MULTISPECIES: histone-like nucleoid-structuring protein Lsr2 [unclassified Pseudoclavibacter]|jgi:hypothetical protein|uniref:histone-like nucleoid-structuring protein Lsr2 n=1 Tax=unclassified Pseudoclavibacter TaxID=2615177 RepID=UPI000CE753BA|nr:MULTISPECIES: Lsr2 family protein [unclassified Pseudoclavibacter]MBS3179542.1 Lsr2 family protein [Pseudoclavibacter sp. Marseille-Q4354]NYF14637.1 hypothetical protein [Pseudoclavibacter sp. JAI123]PPG30633.1 hypothetical protein C5B97_07605 [Pseudoclavibacter sp. RFBB5]